MRIRIPDRYQIGLVKLISLGDDSIQELLSLLDDIPSTFDIDHLKASIVPKLTHVSKDDADAVITTLDSLHFLQSELDLPLSDFVDQICQAMEESGNEKLKFEPSERLIFRDRLFKLMDRKLFAIATKARNILLEHEHIFEFTRVLTDIRSVFDKDVKDPPVAAVLVHLLKIHYVQDQQHKDFFVALDTSDVEVLIETLKRAQEKAETLKSTLTSAKVPYIDAK